MDILKQISENLIKGNDKLVLELATQAIKDKIPPKDILENGLISGMNKVGELFKSHEIFLPEVLMSARAMHTGMDIIKPLLIKEKIPTLGKVVMGTIQGDLHDIGKNLVAIMLRGAGFEVLDLGNDVAPERFVETAKNENAEVIGMSALLTTTMQNMKKVIELLSEQNLLGKIKTIVGGAPLTKDFACEIGADAYAYDAVTAIDCVKNLTT